MEHDPDDLFPTSKRGFHIAHLNVRSMNNKLDLIKIQARQMDFHIFTLSETWLTSDMPDNFLSIKGYNLIRWDRDWHEDGCNRIKKGGGVALYIKDNLTFSQTGLQQYNVSNKNVVCCWLHVNHDNAKDMLIGTVYRPPGGNVEMFCNYFKDTMEEIGNNYNREIFILGDFNVNYLNPNDTGTKLLLEFEQLNGLKQLIKKPSRGLNCIDLLFTNSSDVANSDVLALNISDHDLIFATKKKSCAKRRQVDFIGRLYRNYNRDIFLTRLRHLNWEYYWQLLDPNDCWDYILKGIENEISVMCPLRSHRVRCSNEPWMNNGILEAIYAKDQAWKQAKKSGDMDDINLAKQLRNETEDKIRRAKRDFIEDELDNDLGSSKRFWKKVNLILPARDNGNTIRLVDQVHGSAVDEKSTPDYINNFFTDIGPKLASKFEDLWVDDLPVFEGEMLGDIHVTEQILEKVVKDMLIRHLPLLTFQLGY